MPKSKKKKNKDFQKVKLKVGKRLPKADNETRTSFKARTIQVPEQLRGRTEGKGEPTTHRKLSLTELLSQLQHYNVTVRCSAVTGLRELIGRDSTLLHSHLSVIVGRTSELFTDKDPVVRQAVIRLMRVILPQLSASQIAPFFPVVRAHLCCAMSHIFEEIRLDSLFVLDLFLDSFPGLLTNNSSQILLNFVEQISTHKVASERTRGEKSLSVNPTSKLSTLKWRVKVLERLQKFLTALNFPKEHTCSYNDQSDLAGLGGNVISINQMATHRQQFSPVCKRLWTGYSYTLGTKSLGSTDDKQDTNGLDVGCDVFIKSLLPLLLECWVEATAVDKKISYSVDGLVSPESLVVMVNVVSVIQLLWRYVKAVSSEERNLDWLSDEYRKDFIKHFMCSFPYSVHEAPRRKDKKVTPSSKGKLSGMSLNLSVCDIMCYFLSDLTNAREAHKRWFPPITRYLLSVLQAERLSQENLKCLINIIRQILGSDIEKGTLDQMLEGCYQLFSHAHSLSYEKRLLLNFFSDLPQRPGCSGSTGDSCILKDFYLELPALLKEVASAHHQMAAQILAVMKAGLMQNKLCLSSAHLEDILAPDEGILVSVSSANQRLVVDMMFYVHTLDNDHFRKIATIIRSSAVTEELSCYFVQTLFHRFVCSHTKQSGKALCTLDTFLSFLMTVALGINRAELATLSVDESCPYMGGYLPLRSAEDSSVWHRHKAVAQVTVSLMSQLPHGHSVWLGVAAFLEHLLIHHMTLRLTTCWSVLVVVSELYTSGCPMAEILQNCVVKLSLSLVHFVVTMAAQASRSEEEADWSNYHDDVWKAVVGCLKIVDTRLVTFLEIFQESVLSANCPGVETAVLMLTYIVKTPDLMTYLQVDLQKLNTVADFIQKRFSGVIEQQVLSDLQYHVSVITPGKT